MFDINERIIELRMERHWSEYQLAEKSGIGQSTTLPGHAQNLCPLSQIWRKSATLSESHFPSFLQTKKNARFLFPLYSRKCFTILTV